MNIRESIAKVLWPGVFSDLSRCLTDGATQSINMKKLQDDLMKEKSLNDSCTLEVVKMKELLKYLNISEFEEYLDKNFKTINLMYTKRWVLNKMMFPEALDIRDFIRPGFSLPDFKTLNAVFTVDIRYVSDSYAYNNIMDVWQLPHETWTLGAGDCEDSATLRASLALRAGIPDVFCALGFWGNEGHCFNLVWKDGDIYIVENTSNKYNPVKITDLKNTGNNYRICYVFNKNKAWVIDGSVIFGAKVQKEFNIERRVICTKKPKSSVRPRN